MVICKLFAYYLRNTLHINKGNAIKLFEKIMKPIKAHLQNESSFFWNIFGGIMSFKLWMHKEGLISMETIINQIKRSKFDQNIIEFFLPEIVKEEPDFFDKEIKNKIEPIKYSEEKLNEFIELRQKHFNWLRNSNDYHDSLYREIEKDPLRYAIKTDDIDSFQKIISNNNININSKIDESIIENFDSQEKHLSLVRFSIEYNAINIFKYLIMNDVLIDQRNVYISMVQRNYEIIHILESRIPDSFKSDAYLCSISCWSDEFTEYSLDNYKPKFLDIENDEEYDEDDIRKINDMIENTFFACNFIFLDSHLVPFLRKNQKIVKKFIYDIIVYSFMDEPCYFLKELLKYPEIDINGQSSQSSFTLLIDVIRARNDKAIEILLNFPGIDINFENDQSILPSSAAIISFLDMKTIELFCNHPGFDINMEEKVTHFSIFQSCVGSGNFYATEFLLNKFPNFEHCTLSFLSLNCVKNGNLMTAKTILKFELSKKSKEKLFSECKVTSIIIGFKEEIMNTILSIINELR